MINLSNPLSWMPSLEVLGNRWNIYAILCLLSIFIAGVIKMKSSNKPLGFRIIFSFLVSWMFQVIFIETLSLVTIIVIHFFQGNYDLSYLRWLENIGGYVVEIRLMYIVLPFAFIGYFAYIDRKSLDSKRVFNWKLKWILAMVIVCVIVTTYDFVAGYTQAQSLYDPDSIDRYIVYYFNYVPMYTMYAILGIKTWKGKLAGRKQK